MDERDKSFLGTGWSFPPAFSRVTGGARMVSGDEDIHQSLTVLFATSLGERLMLPQYGCQLDQYVFDKVTVTWVTQIKGLVGQAILLWEPRIDVLNVAVDTKDSANGKVAILIEYRIRMTNVRSNYVYPFYLSEATLPRVG